MYGVFWNIQWRNICYVTYRARSMDYFPTLQAYIILYYLSSVIKIFSLYEQHSKNSLTLLHDQRFLKAFVIDFKHCTVNWIIFCIIGLASFEFRKEIFTNRPYNTMLTTTTNNECFQLFIFYDNLKQYSQVLK